AGTVRERAVAERGVLARRGGLGRPSVRIRDRPGGGDAEVRRALLSRRGIAGDSRRDRRHRAFDPGRQPPAARRAAREGLRGELHGGAERRPRPGVLARAPARGPRHAVGGPGGFAPVTAVAWPALAAGAPTRTPSRSRTSSGSP